MMGGIRVDVDASVFGGICDEEFASYSEFLEATIRAASWQRRLWERIYGGPAH